MSAVPRVSIITESYTKWPEIDVADMPFLDHPLVSPGTKESTKLLDSGTICLLVLGSIPLLAGIITGIWPMALAGLGPWLLVLFDIGQSRRRKKHQAK